MVFVCAWMHVYCMLCRYLLLCTLLCQDNSVSHGFPLNDRWRPLWVPTLAASGTNCPHIPSSKSFHRIRWAKGSTCTSVAKSFKWSQRIWMNLYINSRVQQSSELAPSRTMVNVSPGCPITWGDGTPTEQIFSLSSGLVLDEFEMTVNWQGRSGTSMGWFSIAQITKGYCSPQHNRPSLLVLACFGMFSDPLIPCEFCLPWPTFPLPGRCMMIIIEQTREFFGERYVGLREIAPGLFRNLQIQVVASQGGRVIHCHVSCPNGVSLEFPKITNHQGVMAIVNIHILAACKPLLSAACQTFP